MCAQSLQSCPTPCNPMDCSPPGSSVCGILLASILEWVAMPSSNESSLPRNQTRVPWVGHIVSRLFTAEPLRKPWKYECISSFAGRILSNLWIQYFSYLEFIQERYTFTHSTTSSPKELGSAQYATGDQWRNNSRKNERMEPKQKQHPVVDGTGDRSKVWCWKSNIP